MNNTFLKNKGQILILVVVIMLTSLGFLFAFLMPISYQVVRISNILDSFQAKAYAELAHQIHVDVYRTFYEISGGNNQMALEVLRDQVLVHFSGISISSSSCIDPCVQYIVTTTDRFNNWPQGSSIEIKWKYNPSSRTIISDNSSFGIFRNSRYAFFAGAAP
jgi:hypothetical protein